jgi:hypothetical protein
LQCDVRCLSAGYVYCLLGIVPGDEEAEARACFLRGRAGGAADDDRPADGKSSRRRFVVHDW